MVCSAHEDFSIFGQLVVDCKFLSQQWSNWTLSWVRRQANLAAHLLAGKAILFSSLSF